MYVCLSVYLQAAICLADALSECYETLSAERWLSETNCHHGVMAYVYSMQPVRGRMYVRYVRQRIVAGTATPCDITIYINIACTCL